MLSTSRYAATTLSGSRSSAVRICAISVCSCVRRATGGRIAEELVEQLRMLATCSGTRLAAGQRTGELGEYACERVVALSGAIDLGERRTARRIHRREIRGVLERFLGLDEIAT